MRQCQYWVFFQAKPFCKSLSVFIWVHYFFLSFTLGIKKVLHHLKQPHLKSPLLTTFMSKTLRWLEPYSFVALRNLSYMESTKVSVTYWFVKFIYLANWYKTEVVWIHVENFYQFLKDDKAFRMTWWKWMTILVVCNLSLTTLSCMPTSNKLSNSWRLIRLGLEFKAMRDSSIIIYPSLPNPLDGLSNSQAWVTWL